MLFMALITDIVQLSIISYLDYCYNLFFLFLCSQIVFSQHSVYEVSCFRIWIMSLCSKHSNDSLRANFKSPKNVFYGPLQSHPLRLCLKILPLSLYPPCHRGLLAFSKIYEVYSSPGCLHHSSCKYIRGFLTISFPVLYKCPFLSEDFSYYWT